MKFKMKNSMEMCAGLWQKHNSLREMSLHMLLENFIKDEDDQRDLFAILGVELSSKCNASLMGDILHAYCKEGNMLLTFENAAITGAISTGIADHRDGEPEQDKWWLIGEFYTEMRPVETDKALKVSLDGKSKWVVTGESFITCLDMADGAVVCAPEGKKLLVTVDGKETDPAGKLEGKVILTLI